MCAGIVVGNGSDALCPGYSLADCRTIASYDVRSFVGWVEERLRHGPTTPQEIRNPKSEILNKFKIRKRKTQTNRVRIGFGFRDSIFEFAPVVGPCLSRSLTHPTKTAKTSVYSECCSTSSRRLRFSSSPCCNISSFSSTSSSSKTVLSM